MATNTPLPAEKIDGLTPRMAAPEVELLGAPVEDEPPEVLLPVVVGLEVTVPVLDPVFVPVLEPVELAPLVDVGLDERELCWE
jgi:hypothetical protein